MSAMLRDIYDEVRARAASANDFKAMMIWAAGKGISVSNGIALADSDRELFINVVTVWDKLQTFGEKVSLVGPQLGEAVNLTEAAYSAAFKAGTVLRAAPDPAGRVKFLYADGIRVGYLCTKAGAVKVYSSNEKCWAIIASLEMRFTP